MKSLSLKLAVVGALSLAGANAMALAPAAIDSSVVRVYVGGATASDNALENLAKLSTGTLLCQANTLDIYYFKSSSASIQNRVLFCTAGFTNTAATIPAAERITAGVTKIAVFKESQGGSANGIVNVARTTPLQFIDFFSGSSNVATACATVTSAVPAAGDFSAFNTRDCGASAGVASTVVRTLATGTPNGSTIIAPTAGVSDVDPDTFVGLGGVLSSDAAALTRKRTSLGVVFNPIVSVPLFTALQRAQGLVAGTTENTTSIGLIPTVPSPLLRGIFTGTVLDATQIYSNGVQLSTLAPTGDTAVYICRRGDTSGTMTSFKIQYLGQGCTKNPSSVAKFVSPDQPADEAAGKAWNSTTYAADFVFAGAGSGDVRSCLDYQTSQGRFAVGVASVESKPNTTNSRWRYVKVDGAEPTIKAVMEGRYDFFTENTLNDKYSATVSSGAQAIFDQAASLIGNKTVLSKVNESWQNAAQIGVTVTASVGIGEGDTGVVDIPVVGTANVPTFPVAAAQVRSNPVNSMKRAAGTAANNCNRTIQVAP
jgi:hypothetical protein